MEINLTDCYGYKGTVTDQKTVIRDNLKIKVNC